MNTVDEPSTRMGAVSRLLRRCASRALNAWRLRNLSSHRERVGRARAVLGTVRNFTGADAVARTFGYLRRVDALVFEEVVLTAFEDAGAIVLRNRRYSGDGGVDGRVWLPGNGRRPWAIQSKRYAAHVCAQHLATFAGVVRRHHLPGGLFIHCGRSGALCYEHARGSPVWIVSGEQFVALLLRGQIPRPPP